MTYRDKELIMNLLDEMMTDVGDKVMVNSILEECGEGVKIQFLERLRREEERRKMLEKQKEQKEAWKRKWEKLEREITMELKALEEYEHLLEESIQEAGRTPIGTAYDHRGG